MRGLVPRNKAREVLMQRETERRERERERKSMCTQRERKCRERGGEPK